MRCSDCLSYACGAGHSDLGPDTCPMRGDFPPFDELYDGRRRQMLYQAALVESEGYCRWTRAREIVEFSRRMGWTRVGIAHCSDTVPEAGLASQYLGARGLEVVGPFASPQCDPLAQASHMAGAGSELNVICGMCPGHEAMFIRASAAPVTGFVARDVRLRHNPVAALYTSDGYSRRLVYGRRAPAESTYRGSDVRELGGAWAEALTSLDACPNRVVEVMEFARCLGARHIGLSFCVGFKSEARVLTRILEANGFKVSSACCKTGAVPKEAVGILDSQKVRPGQAEMTCNPVTQAELLNRQAVQLALVLGQCVGHDSATLFHLEAPAVLLVVKDRVLAHNTAATLYEAATDEHWAGPDARSSPAGL